jgi:hypothetical protein
MTNPDLVALLTVEVIVEIPQRDAVLAFHNGI